MGKKSNKTKKSKCIWKEIDNCPICQEILCRPTVLGCQHVFCFECLRNWTKKQKNKAKKCPLCTFPYCPPTTHNQLLESIFMANFPEEYERRLKDALEQQKKEKIRKKIYKDIEKEIRKEIYATLSRDPENWIDDWR